MVNNSAKLLFVLNTSSFFVAIILLFLSSTSMTFAGLNSEPVLKAPLHQRDRYSTDLFTGSVNYSYPINVPKGTDNLTPNVNLSYSSAGIRDLKTYLGLGWQLNQDFVERDVNFTPTNTGDDIMKLHFKGMVYELVYRSSDNTYHTKVESNVKIQSVTGGSNDYGGYWNLTTPDGTLYRFGYSSGSELVCNGRSYVSSWNLDEVTDVHGNKIYYSYLENNGVSYLNHIKYNTDETRIIDFNYSTNPYEHPVYTQGCLAYDLKRLTNIQVKISSTLIREYDLAFDDSQNGQPILESITENGNDRSHLPATTFEYKNSTYSWHTPDEKWFDNFAYTDLSLDKTKNAMADVNGDGLVDVVRGTNVWRVFLNTGNNWSTTYQEWANSPNLNAEYGDSDVNLIDVTGDGLPDIIKSAPQSGGRITWYVWRNTGSSWVTTPEYWVNNDFVDANISDSATTVTDVNGDGLPDIVKTHYQTGTPPSWKVYKNTGSSWNTTYENWTAPVEVALNYQNIKMFDANGDGLPDIVKTVYSGTVSTWYVYKNTGSGWGAQEMWLDADVDAHFLKDNVTVSDVNGDGLPDIVKGLNISGLNSWFVLLNRGGSWSSTWQEWIHLSSMDANPAVVQVRLADVTGDGLPDIVRGDHNGGNVIWRVWKNNGNSPDLLSVVHTPQGGIISFNYKNSTSIDNTGSDAISDLPFPMWIADTMTVNNGLSNDQETEDVTTYTYLDGLYDWQDREFRGFREVATSGPDSSKKQYIFNQDDAKKGRLASILTKDNSNNPYDKSESNWDVATSSGIFTVNLTEEKNYSYDGVVSNPKITQTNYTYDSYGNITKKSEMGDTSISGDERFIYNEYTYNTSDWLINTVKHQYTNASDDSTKVLEQTNYYDGHSTSSASPTKGNLTKTVKWLSGLLTTDPVTEFVYDSFGNQTSMTDANSHTTTTAYDTTGTYPTSNTNAKSQTSYTDYDLGTGNLLSKTDPNSLTTSYIYDVYGRIAKEIKPYDTSTYPTTAYQYFTDGVDGTLVSKRKVSGQSSVLKTYIWVDGLGRQIQTRADAEDDTKQIVTNTYYDPNNQVKKVTVPHLVTTTDYYTNPTSGIRNTTTTFDVLKRPVTITNPKGDDKTISYDHWKETLVDENGHTKKVYKNAYGKNVKVEELNGASTYTTLYDYDSRDLLTKITDTNSNETIFGYDSLGRKISQTDPDMGTWVYEYDGVGNLTKQTDNRNVSITKTYDQLNRLTKTDYPTDTDTTYLYDANSKKGTLSIATDSAGMVAYSYDNRLRKTQEQRTVNGITKTTQFSYDAADRVTSQTNPDSEVVTTGYNHQGEIASVSGVLNSISYNALGKITQKGFVNGLTTNYTYNTTDFRLNRIQTGSLQDLNYTYDNVGNISSIADSVSTNTKTYTYDPLDRLKTATESAGLTYAYGYNGIGNLTVATVSGATTNYGYDSANKVHAMNTSSESVSSPHVNPTGTPPTSFVTDNWDSGSIDQSKWTNWGGSNVTVSSGELTMTSSLSGGYYGTDSGVTHKVYNLTGSSVVNKLVNAGNQSLGSWEVYPLYAYVSGNSSTQYFFYVSEGTLRAYKKVSGSNTVLASTTYNSTNHKWFRIREASGTTYFDTSANGVNWTNFASTANAFTLTSLVVGAEVGTWSSESSTTAAVFDNFNYATLPADTLTDDWHTGSISSANWNNWAGGQAAITSSQLALFSTTGGGYYGVDSETSGKLYNLTNSQVVNKLVSAGNQSLGSWEVYPIYAYVSGDSSTQYFFYLSENTLRAYKKVSGSNTVLASASYNATNHKWFRIRESQGTTYFDTSANGGTWTNFASTSNAFSVTSLIIGTEVGTWSSEATSTTALFDNFNVWSPVYMYDANGNMTSDGNNCYEYNEANQLSRVTECGNGATIAAYLYDFTGNRMVKSAYVQGSVANTVTSWSDTYETNVINGGSSENTTYYWVNGELLAKKNPNGSKNYYHSDHLGSTTIMSNSSGVLSEQTSYDPWGKVQSGGTLSKFQYTGQEKDTESGLNYYNARYYSSDIRRFTQPDDIIEDPYNPQSVNRYSYVWNNPLKYTDPTGHCIWDACITELSALALAVSTSPDLQSDIQSLAIDSTEFQNSPTIGNGTGVVLSALALGIPVVPNGGISKGASKAIDKGITYYYNNMSTFRRWEGKAGEGMHWGHVVEQTQKNVDRFGKQMIHNTENVFPMPKAVNQGMNAYYSSKPAGSSFTRREIISQKSYVEQYKFGMDIYTNLTKALNKK